MRGIKRVFWGILLLGALLAGVVAYARYIEPNRLTVNRLSIGSSTPLPPLKIVFLSDTHFGRDYPQEKLEALVRRINEQQPDMVILGGDFFDAYRRDQKLLDLAYLGEQLGEIQAAVKIAVWGNHDYGGGASRVYPALLQKGGFTLLKNQALTIREAGVTVVGLDDYLLGSPALPAREEGDETYRILVTHAPDVADTLELQAVDLLLAGHSHGGQVALPWITKRILPLGAQRYTKGLYQLSGERNPRLFVSKGLGTTVLPVRFLNPPEIVVIEIAPDPQ